MNVLYVIVFHPFFRNVAKVGIAGGAVYITLEQGIWSGPREGAVNFTRLTHTIPNQEKYVNQVSIKSNR